MINKRLIRTILILQILFIIVLIFAIKQDKKVEVQEVIKIVEVEVVNDTLIKELQNEIKELQEENEQLRTIRAKLTAYSPLDNVDGRQAQGDPTKTSRGYTVGRGIAAVDPKKIPYGTILEIPDYGIVECQDTGGALRRDNQNIRIDLFHETYKDAINFGVQDKEIKIIKWGE